MSRSLRQGSWVHQGVVRPLVVAIALSLIVPSRAVAGDPMPVRDAGTGATATPTTPAGVQVATQTSTTFGTGDVFVAVGDGKVQWRLPDGTLNATLDTSLGGFTTGMAFDKLNNLYVTDFTAGAVTRFDSSGTRLGTFGTGYNCNPESITFDAGQFMYVGQAGCSKDILRFNADGTLANTYDVQTLKRRIDEPSDV